MRRVTFGSAFRKTSLKAARLAGVLALILMAGNAAVNAQSGGDARTQDQSKQPPAGNVDAARENQRKIDEFAEAAQAINGPAGNPECVWLGRRVVGLMWRDDLDTAFRHLDMYDRFGCPGGHVQAAFRCLTRFGAVDPKVPDGLNTRVHACWINPAAQPAAYAPSAPASGGTTPSAPPSSPPTAAPTPTAPAKQ